MGAWALPLLLVGFWGIAQLDLDCAHKSRSRAQLDRIRLAEIETAEDNAQAALREKYRRLQEEFEVRCRASLT